MTTRIRRLPHLRSRLALLRRAGRARAQDRLAAAAAAIHADLPDDVAATETPTPSGLAVTLRAPDLVARELGTAAAPARPVVAPVLAGLARPSRTPDPEP
ncbi:hypothetical protein [Methylobacterium sp. JK268]